MKENQLPGEYILAVDVGSTLIKSIIYDTNVSVISKSSQKLPIERHSENGSSEIDPDKLWSCFIDTIRQSIGDAYIDPGSIICMGLCCQRNTFITWDKKTGEPFHKFISWNDTRASDLCESWNKSLTFKSLNGVSSLFYGVSRSLRFLAGSIYQLKTRMVTPRLLWAISKYPELKKQIDKDQVYFGCLESWLLWKLTGKREFSTEISLASSTGMFDPFILDYGRNILKLLNFPLNILPNDVKDTSCLFGNVDTSIFGTGIPIMAMVGDQQADTFACCCFEPGSVKLTLGTGMFINMNTSTKPHTSIHGIYPLIGWKIGKDLCYLAESSASDCGTTIDWAQSIGLFDDVLESSFIATSVQNSNGVYFVPAFSGLQAPINDDKASGLFIGLKSSVRKEHLVRAILESVAFRFHQIFTILLAELEFRPTCIRCVGGVSKNDFICQTIADLSGLTVARMEHDEMGALGVAFLAGLAANVWKGKRELYELCKTSQNFEPSQESRKTELLNEYRRWEKAVARSRSWNND